MTDLQRFIWEHRDDDPVQMALSAKKYPDLPVAYIARQLEALGKIRRKIPTWYQQGLEFPVSISVEQASSEATARFKASLFSGHNMADLTGGLGVDISFFAQHFDEVQYVEKIPEILAAAQHNLGVLERDNIGFNGAEAGKFLSSSTSVFDLLYLDPARRDNHKGKVFQLADCSPNVLEIIDLMLDRSPKILLKTAPLLDIHQALQQLRYVSKVWVVEYDGDCREVLYLLEKGLTPIAEIPRISVVLNHAGNSVHTFEFTLQEEQQTDAGTGLPQEYLYEPFPAVLKAGGFKIFAHRYGLHKLHANTHLYTSVEAVSNIPARSFRIEAVCKYDKKAVAPYIPEGKANITTRNFPDNTEQVRKKLGLKDGGDKYLFAATDVENNKVLLVCHKVPAL